MADILIGQSYYLKFDPKSWSAMQPYAPLGSLYAASYLRTKGFEVALFDAMLASGEADWDEALARERPRIAVIYEDNFNYLSKMCLLRMRQAAYQMIELSKERGCLVIVAGSDPSDHAMDYLQKGADYVLIGEGEETLSELTSELFGSMDLALDSLLGLAYLSDGKVFMTPRRPDMRNLDELPFPAWDLVDVDRYRQIWMERHGYFSLNMATTRGCPFHCNWCAKPIWGQRYNVRSPENVLAEMQWLRDSYHPDHIWFADDIMGLKPGWLPRFAELIEEEGIFIPFKCLNRADLLLRPGEIDALKKAGCQIVWTGAESGSQKILDAMEKGTQISQIYEAAARLHAAGIQVGFFLQFGYPGETRKDIECTFQMIRDCKPDDIGISVSYPLPGTPFFERVKGELGIKKNWNDSNDLAMLYRGPYSTKFYRQLHRIVHKEFRLQKYRNKVDLTIQSSSHTPKRSTLRSVFQKLRPVVDRSTLFVDRIVLKLLEFLPHRGLQSLSPRLSPNDAARPTPQEGHEHIVAR
jgi:anaerobic magnesium-protoporphyrin IX monomethyl ester cyclase